MGLFFGFWRGGARGVWAGGAGIGLMDLMLSDLENAKLGFVWLWRFCFRRFGGTTLVPGAGY